MRVLVTGGAGFIGSHLVKALLKRGDNVTVLDDLSTGRRSNLDDVNQNARFRFVRGSVTALRALAPLAKNADQIYHLAAAVGVRLIVERPLESLLTNLEGTKNVLIMAEKHGCPALIASSSEVYGKNPKVPFAEDADRIYGSVTRERWGYALSKAVDELLAILYAREGKARTIVARYFNTTGPYQSSQYGMVVPTFVRQALSGAPITVFGDGKQYRCFSYVDDIVRGTMLLMESKRAYGEVFNLGSNEPVTINALAKKVKKMTGSSSEIVHIPYSEAYNDNFEDMRGRIPDITKARQYVGYEPKFCLDQILKKTIDYQKKYGA